MVPLRMSKEVSGEYYIGKIAQGLRKDTTLELTRMRVPPFRRLTGRGRLGPGKSNHQRKPSGDVTLRFSLQVKVDDKNPGDRRDKIIPGDKV